MQKSASETACSRHYSYCRLAVYLYSLFLPGCDSWICGNKLQRKSFLCRNSHGNMGMWGFLLHWTAKSYVLALTTITWQLSNLNLCQLSGVKIQHWIKNELEIVQRSKKFLIDLLHQDGELQKSTTTKYFTFKEAHIEWTKISGKSNAHKDGKLMRLGVKFRLGKTWKRVQKQRNKTI